MGYRTCKEKDSKMTQKEFIQNVLIGEIGDVVSHHQYLSFALISAGIELLGTCIESPINSFHIWGKSELRFKSAINQLFPQTINSMTNCFILSCGVV